MHLTLKRFRLRPAAAVALLIVAAACRDDEGVLVRHVAFEGVRQVDEAALRNAVETTGTGALPWSQPHYFNRQIFDDDLKRIEAFYAARGYPDARVSAYRAHYTDDHRDLDLTVIVDEGQPVRVGAVAYDGFAVLPADHRDALVAHSPVVVGRPLDTDQVEYARSLALDELRDHGYPDAAVRVDETAGGAPRTRDVRFVATPGVFARIGSIAVAGNASVAPSVILRQLSVKPGDVFQLSRLQTSQRDLYGLDLFQFASVTPGPVDPQTQDVPVTVTVVESKHRHVTFGVGYGSEEHARATVSYTHVNFLGGARTAGVEGKWSSLDRGVRLNFTQPAFLGPRIDFGASAQNWLAVAPAYSLRTTGGRLNLLYQFHASDPLTTGQRRATATFSLIHEYENYTISDAALADPTVRPTLIALGLNPVTGAGHGTLSALSLDAQVSSIQNPLDARQGSLVSLHLEAAAPWLGGDYRYQEVGAEARRFIPINRRVIVAARVHVSFIGNGGHPDVNVPFFKRYFLGGATSLRGWGRFEVAPLTPAGLPIGGFSLFESSAELREYRGDLGGVLFVDAGNVWDESWRLHPLDLRADAGLGFRYQTPIGPIRVDWAWQLTPIPGLVVNGSAPGGYRHWRLHFSIGQAF